MSAECNGNCDQGRRCDCENLESVQSALKVAQDNPYWKEEAMSDLPKDPRALDVQIGGGHYKGMKIQPVEYIHANNIPFIEGAVIKYVSRWRTKGGIEDVKKARHFLDLLIELEGRK